MNICTFSGFLGGDAESRNVAPDKKVANFSLAVTTGWGERKATMWVKCAVWGKPAEWAAELRKGDGVVVTGELAEREWTGKDGAKGKSLELTVREFVRMAKADGSPRGAVPPGGTSPRDPQPNDDDIPF